MQQDPIKQLLQKMQESFQSSQLVKITMSKPRSKQAGLKNIIISPVVIKSTMMLHFVYRHTTQDITKNYPFDEAVAIIEKSIEQDFNLLDMYMVGENIKILMNKQNVPTIVKRKVDLPAPVSFDHNRTRERIIETHGNIWLRELGITNQKDEVRHEMKDKYLQINRYVEILEPEIARIDKKTDLKVADMGSGKGYLTFALYDYLRNKFDTKVSITGVEYRQELVEICNVISGKAAFENLVFLQGTIEEAPVGDTDILIALHACDTATDEAIFRGISSGASLIVCAPCCHKQIRNEIKLKNPMSQLLKHGILLERQAEIVTDSLRALIMEAFGYKTKVFEFISSEHTSKNVMIIGRKITQSPEKRVSVLEHIAEIKAVYGIKRHYLEDLLEI